jgi:hypothetical protein
VVTRLHDEVYARLPYGRLVLIGGPGSGKTGAMILTELTTSPSTALVGGAQLFTQIVVFVVAFVVWWRRRSRRPGSEPLLETPVTRAVTGAFAAACPVGVWVYLVGGFDEFESGWFPGVAVSPG